VRPVERSRFRRTFFVGKVIIYTSIFFAIGVVVLLYVATSEEDVTVVGTVEPRFHKEVHALDAGVLVDVKFLGGEMVRADELMAQLDDKKLVDELVRKKSQVTEADGQFGVLQMKAKRLQKDPAQTDQYRFARTELEVAQKEVEAENKEVTRMETLVREKVAAPAELDREKVKLEQTEGKLKTAKEKVRILDLDLSKDMLAEAQAEMALQEKRLAGLKEELKTIESNIERCKIRAPISGEVVYSAKKPGESVTPGELIFNVAQGSAAEVHAFVEESQILKVALGQRVRIYPKSFDQREYGEAKGTVTAISSHTEKVPETNQLKFKVWILVDETPLPLKFGTNVDAYIVVNTGSLLDMIIRR